MSMMAKLAERAEAGKPVRVGLIGAGKFGSMFLSQAPRARGLHRRRHRRSRRRARAPARPRMSAGRASGLPRNPSRKRRGTADRSSPTTPEALIAADGIDVVIEATGNPAAGVAHALACCKNGRHVVMVNVEADALAGPLLARKAKEAGIVYSLAYGDQPALIAELVDWARLVGFEVVVRRQGHEIPARLSRFDARDGVAPLRAHRGRRRRRRPQRQDVQFLPGRDEIGDRDGGGRQRDRPRRAEGRPRLSALRRR